MIHVKYLLSNRKPFHVANSIVIIRSNIQLLEYLFSQDSETWSINCTLTLNWTVESTVVVISHLVPSGFIKDGLVCKMVGAGEFLGLYLHYGRFVIPSQSEQRRWHSNRRRCFLVVSLTVWKGKEAVDLQFDRKVALKLTNAALLYVASK